jgi:hypothetical protein
VFCFAARWNLVLVQPPRAAVRGLSRRLRQCRLVSSIFAKFLSFVLSFLFSGTQLLSLLRVVFVVFFALCIDDHGSLVIFRSASARPRHLSDQNFDHDCFFKLPWQGAGRPITWTVFYSTPCLVPSCFAYEPNSKDGESSQPLRHTQCKRTAMRCPNATLAMLLCRRIATCMYRRRQCGLKRAARLCSLCQQVAPQGIPLLADVPQPLLAGVGVFTQDHPQVHADLFASAEPLRCSDDQHVGKCRDRAHARMGHQSQRVGSFLDFLFDIVRAAGDAFIERNRHWLRWRHVRVLLAIGRCRSAALGGHLDECTRCGHRAIFVRFARTSPLSPYTVSTVT